MTLPVVARDSIAAWAAAARSKGIAGADVDLEFSGGHQAEYFLGAPAPLLGVEQEVVDFRAGDGQGAVGVEMLQIEGWSPVGAALHLPAWFGASSWPLPA